MIGNTLSRYGITGYGITGYGTAITRLYSAGLLLCCFYYGMPLSLQAQDKKPPMTSKHNQEKRERALTQMSSLIPMSAEAIVFCEGRIAKREAKTSGRRVDAAPQESPNEQLPSAGRKAQQEAVDLDQRIHEFNTLLFSTIDGGKWWDKHVASGKSSWSLAIGEHITDGVGGSHIAWSQHIGFDSTLPDELLSWLKANAAREEQVEKETVYVIGIDKSVISTGSIFVFKSGKASIGAAVEREVVSRLIRHNSLAGTQEKPKLVISKGQLQFGSAALPINAYAQAWGARLFEHRRDSVTTKAFGEGAIWLGFEYLGKDPYLDVFYCDKSQDAAVPRLNAISSALFNGHAATSSVDKGIGRSRVQMRAATSKGATGSRGVTTGEACLGVLPLFGMSLTP